MRFLVPILLFALAFGPASTVLAAEDDEASLDPIKLSLSLYIVDGAEAPPTSELSSRRDVESMEQIHQKMQAIWGQAGIELVVGSVARIVAPADTLIDLSQGNTAAFLSGVYDGGIEVPDPGALNGFYVRSLERINGLTPIGTRVFFVTDEPSVHDERVSSHEIGHILGLHHEARDSSHLMFSGTNGMELTDDEIWTARYVAQGIVDGLR
ncbi:MAG: hypothetical protein U9O18_04415 [Chloroflexota bacterium]|nr:hypothetical protein [Chloroflexota bacterium]